VPLPLRFTDTRIQNPVLTDADVIDYGLVNYVADPFLLPGTDCWRLFFEVFNRTESPTAVIGHATSDRLDDWKYDVIALETSIHLSFPCIFKWDGEYYMLPDQKRDRDYARVEMFRATEFPTEWESTAVLVDPPPTTANNVLFRWQERWWLVVGHEESGSSYVYYSDELETKSWEPHANNPVIEHQYTTARPGRVRSSRTGSSSCRTRAASKDTANGRQDSNSPS